MLVDRLVDTAAAVFFWPLNANHSPYMCYNIYDITDIRRNIARADIQISYCNYATLVAYCKYATMRLVRTTTWRTYIYVWSPYFLIVM